jgi:hypothetical protein
MDLGTHSRTEMSLETIALQSESPHLGNMNQLKLTIITYNGQHDNTLSYCTTTSKERNNEDDATEGNHQDGDSSNVLRRQLFIVVIFQTNEYTCDYASKADQLQNII